MSTTLPITLPAETGTLADRALIVNLSISQWSARATDKRVNREVADRHGSKEEMGNYRKCLIAKDAIAAVTKAAGAARLEHYNLTLPWRDSGDRILSSVAYLKYAEKMRELESKFWEAVGSFCENYPALVDAARLDLNGLFNEKDYPPSSEIRSKFAWKIEVNPVAVADDFRVNLGEEETERIKSQMRAESSAQLTRAMADVWGRMREVVQNMSDRLKVYKQTAEGVENPFRDSLVTNIQSLLAIVPSLNIANDPNIAQFAAAIGDELTRYSPEQLRNSQMRRDDTAQRADEILAKMSAFLS